MKEDVLPEGWVKINIQKAFSQVSTTGKKVPTKDILPFGKYPVIDQGEEFISGYFNNKDKVISTNSGIVIFGDHTRNFKLVNFDFIPGGDGIKILKPNVGIDLEFFYFQCLYLELPDKGYHRHFKYFKESNFYLPPLPEQQYLSKKLIALLDEVAQTKQRLEAIPALLKQFRQSVLADAVSGRLTEEWRKENDGNSLDYRELCISEREKRYGKKVKKLSELDILPKLDLPNSWSWKAIDEVCLKITDGTHHSPENTESGDYMYVTSKNVREGYIDLSNITYVDKETHKEIFARCDVAYGDVLYVKDGANTGLACVNNIEEQISLLSSVSVLKQCSFVNPHYLQHYLNSPIGRKLMLGMMSGTAIKRLTLTKIVASPIPIPPKEEQTQIVQKVETYFALADEIETQVKTALENVNLLTQSILAKAFNGELSAVWRNSQVTETQGNV